jgi:hypothetical protein
MLDIYLKYKLNDKKKKILIIGNKICKIKSNIDLNDFDVVVRINKMDNYENISGKTDILYINCKEDYLRHKGGNFLSKINEDTLLLFPSFNDNYIKVLDLFEHKLSFKKIKLNDIIYMSGINCCTSFCQLVFYFLLENNDVYITSCDVDNRYEILKYHQNLKKESEVLLKLIKDKKITYYE